MDTPSGTLYLIPAPLGPGGEAAIPEYVRSTMHGLDHFLAEKAKTARHFLKSTDLPRPIQEYKVEELNKHTPAELIPDLLQPLLQGKDMGLLSEAGCPGIADPGARAVAVAHDLGIKVVPLVGPSSILLGLMASGLNGQHFIFHGYLSPKRPQLMKELRRLEQQSRREKQTQIFIETPYRNMKMLETIQDTLQMNTRFCVAADLTLPTEWVKTMSIQDWLVHGWPDLHKRPAIFLFQA